MSGVAILVLVGCYFLPTIIAAARQKRNTMAIGALNFFLGWSFIGWIVALIWALASDPQMQQIIVSQNVGMPYYQHPGMPPGTPPSPPHAPQSAQRSGPPMAQDSSQFSAAEHYPDQYGPPNG